MAPGTLHVQNQNTTDTITKAGLSVKRVASRIGVSASPFNRVNEQVDARWSQCEPGCRSRRTNRNEDEGLKRVPV